MRQYHTIYLPLPLDSDGKPVPVTAADSPITMPGIDEPVPDNWVTQTGRYFIVYAINIPLLDPMTLLSPDSRYVPLKTVFDIIIRISFGKGGKLRQIMYLKLAFLTV